MFSSLNHNSREKKKMGEGNEEGNVERVMKRDCREGEGRELKEVGVKKNRGEGRWREEVGREGREGASKDRHKDGVCRENNIKTSGILSPFSFTNES